MRQKLGCFDSGHGVLHHAGVDGYHVVIADVLDVAGAQQDLLHLLPEVEAGPAVMGGRDRPWQLRKLVGDKDVAAAG